jgi:hypothetical protein
VRNRQELPGSTGTVRNRQELPGSTGTVRNRQELPGSTGTVRSRQELPGTTGTVRNCQDPEDLLKFFNNHYCEWCCKQSQNAKSIRQTRIIRVYNQNMH